MKNIDTENMKNNPIEELRRMEMPVSEKGWESIVNDPHYKQHFGKNPKMSPKGRIAIVASAVAVLITVPILVKTLRQQPADQAQPAISVTEVTAPQPTENQSTATITTSPRTSTQTSNSASAVTPQTKPTLATTTQAAAHEGSTMASVIEKRQSTATPTTSTAQPDNSLSYDDIKVSPERPKPARLQHVRTVHSCSPATKDKPSVCETTITVDGEEVAKYEYSPEEPEAEVEEFFIPSAFTPNGDGLNDLFYINANFEPRNFELTIFNRNGERVFQTRDMNIGWDGKIRGTTLPFGMYVYIIKYKDSQGNEQQKQGQILLVP